ncbi:MAG TPA: putative Na+/H+ antiporter, partial [Bdellovibrionota bacterium]|nr:putative Na+/H+ antiporter [Bdellovibrionota bacterium]
MTSPSQIELLGTVTFAFAILHTFSSKFFRHLGGRFREGSVAENLFHLLGEVEIVFALWAAILVAVVAAGRDPATALALLEERNFTEPAFVFAIMTVAATTPILEFANRAMRFLSRLMPLPPQARFYFTCLLVGPILGSFITEPAAMTVTALMLRDRFFGRGVSDRFKYVTLGTLFVNVSIGGVLTPYAAPPVLMVAREWDWDLAFMLSNFGWKAAIACALNAGLATWLGLRDLGKSGGDEKPRRGRTPFWLQALNIGALALIVLSAHHMIAFIGVLLLFLGLVEITREYQDELKLKESLLVACFLGGLVVLGSFQGWWLRPILSSLGELPLLLGATALTAVTDNAALTYLGTQVPGLSQELRYALVAGAVTGGGLTVIANAPNPAGYSILQKSFGPEGISALRLLLGALAPT